MNCKIADLVVEVPATGDLVSRCCEYLYEGNEKTELTISEEEFNLSRWTELTLCDSIYMESGFQFSRKVLVHGGVMLHASAVEKDGKAFLFSGPCGVGKSTHTRIWKQINNDEAIVINDDKPILRKIDGVWFAYGTPWCGKDGINENKKIPLAGICFLEQGKTNSIRRLRSKEALIKMLTQTNRKFRDLERLDIKLRLVDQLIRDIPIYELTNNATPESAILSYETMRRGAEEAGL